MIPRERKPYDPVRLNFSFGVILLRIKEKEGTLLIQNGTLENLLYWLWRIMPMFYIVQLQDKQKVIQENILLHNNER